MHLWSKARAVRWQCVKCSVNSTPTRLLYKGGGLSSEA